jgi:hypothetical protein
MTDTNDMMLWYALYRFTTDYWFEVDFRGGAAAHDFYLSDALFAVGDNRFEGQEKIRAFYARRRQHGRPTTRHLVNSLQVSPVEERQLRLVGVLTLYSADGRPPFESVRPPALIADIAADCVRGDDEGWRFRSHILSPIFVGSDRPRSMSIDTQRL